MEQIGIERALDRAHTADLVLLLTDMASPLPAPFVELDAIDTLRIGTKLDVAERTTSESNDLNVSIRSGEGLNELLAALRS
ncbi:hypothetical protein SJ299_25095, partial [Enterobacter hormaechei]|uniref:hypothetical protein n=1 Tax=Enterobacter hormaechei TaxID=158836 RepID=UPI0029D85000